MKAKSLSATKIKSSHDSSSEAFQDALRLFNPKKYQQLANFNRQQWGQQFAKRADISWKIDHAKKAEERTSLVQGLIDDPLSPYELRYDNKSGKDYPSPIIPLRFRDMDRLQALRKDFPLGGELPIDEWSIANREIGLVSRGHIIVDLTLRDNDIKTAFNNWLKEIRSKTGFASTAQKSNNLSVEMLKWNELRILMYFDLTAWCKNNDLHFFQHQLLRILYPELYRDAPTEQVNENRGKLTTARTRAKKVITLAYAHELCFGSLE